jgi:SSS family solute:Na+ symporter
MLAVVFFTVMAVSVVVAFLARTGLRTMTVGEFLVGGRSFPGWLLYFLAVGEIYSIGTMIGLPGGIYAKGASYGVWFLGYILLAYAIGYFVAPLIWRAGVRYDAMTLPDIFRRHYGSRALELVTAVCLIVALVPWGQYQFIGLQVVLGGLGLSLSPLQSVVLAGGLAFLYLAVSGVRSPAFVAILKDSFMVLGIVVAGVAAVVAAGGVEPTVEPGTIPRGLVTMHGSALVFAMTTILVQSVTFYILSAAFLFTARSERAVKASTVWMPLYMLMYPFLVAASYYAIHRYPHVPDPNSVFMVVTRGLLPDWLVGIVAAGAGLSGVLVLATTALALGGIVSRNLVPDVRPDRQRRWTTLVVAVFLVAAALLTLSGSTLMLTVLNLVYYLCAQFVPALVAVMFVRRVQPWAVGTGLVVGVVASIALYAADLPLGGVNLGLVTIALNAALTFGLSLLRPGPERTTLASWRPTRDRVGGAVREG